MKITSAAIYKLSIPMIPFQIATGTMKYAQNIFIRLHTDRGYYGAGECSAFPVITGETQETCFVMAREFAKLWIGKDPLDITERMSELHLFTANNMTIKSAFDMALFDLGAKHAGLPLYKFLKGKKRPVETDITIGIGSIEEMTAQALAFISEGASKLKVKLGKGAREDIERITKIREAAGPSIAIRIDANQGWSFEEAVFILNTIAPLQIEFCEQPMRSWYDDYLPKLVRTSPVAIMADESCYNHHDARKLISNKACNAINIKFSKSGGILEALQIYHTATAANIPCMIGGMLESRIALSAKLHFAYACPEISFFDLDTCLLGHLEDPCIGGAVYKNFFLSIDDTPGIGADADDRFLAKCENLSVK